MSARPHESAWPCDLHEKFQRARVDSTLSDDGEAFVPDRAPAGAPAPERSAARQPRELTIRACSWNLNGGDVDDREDLSRWLGGGLADVLVVGVQELIELKPSSVLRSRSGNRSGRAAFEERIESAISCQGSYKKVCSYGVVGLAIFVYVREDLVPLIGGLEMESVKTGFRGALGNKGAVCARIRIGSFSACFVNVHLAAGTGKAKKRERHLSKIIARSGTAGRCQFTAILGDFNSRLELGPEASPAEGGERTIRAGWLSRDEIVNGRLESLKGFSEGLVRFPPTFGYLPGSDVVGRRCRPAWTDRVLYRAATDARAELQEYGAFPDVLRTSDHRPVAARFKVSLEC